MKRTLLTTGAAVGAGAALTRVRRFRPPASPDVPHADVGAVDACRAADHLAQLIRIPTVSRRDPEQVDQSVFSAFRDRLGELYPHTHRELELELLGTGAMLFHWRSGSDAPPLVLMAHYDVVPADGQAWTHDPFAGEVIDGVVHGRGAIDDKGALVAVLEAVESLLAEGFRPARDVYLSFGNDEEVAGTGARTAAETLAARGITPWAVVDEGGAVVTGVFPGVPGPIAVVGIAEKGVVDLELTTEDAGGHASSPVRGGATARLARALVRLDEDPFPARVSDVVLALVDTIGRHAPAGHRAVYAHAALLRPVLAGLLSRAGREASALVRTTVAITQLEGSRAPNVLATRARAVANVRVVLGETAESAIDRIRRVVDDPSVRLEATRADDPSPVSRTDNEAWATLTAAIRAAHPGATVTPYLMVQASDARHFAKISDSVYRFMPFDLSSAQLASLHAADEHLTVAALARGVAFYRELLQRS
ncbi:MULTISPECIES: M20/M25/M40 family metallo-hydrolase [unclassified Modestobacter]|uniref:M20/M25/M40 family metallo-hydrolase n=1 Tax=unclassified Modestobacter TaxID=2643866 RepID=UPI0022AAC0AB|nr:MULTISPECIES: M20/M25/M40 family metallo-hydrolase [unclassified Modestobacter]MCZ2824637.1 M20/M25/M40 family metallo-hydrolase [Modestobacter sp. VKM Ac-2981]MCZ2854860.1 M20/M25/M40 family metallo-hydrolase [Modestobacter sp. VKM Ac-2982]